ncbi:MAG TPA: tetratricopeptide repeat protein [Pyrinomonadaceae bacterium]|nr:tetratricopeptide repeat protein [Pyrinomonadaceae bacterium]
MGNISGLFGSIKKRLFFLSSFVSAGAVAAFVASDQSAGMAVTVALQTLAGFASNLGSSEVYDIISKRITHEDVLRNKDLTRAVRNAIRDVLLAEADEAQVGEDREALRTIADAPPETWELVEVLQGDALEGISSENLSEMFSKTPEEFAGVKALEPQSWRELLRWLEKEQSVARMKSVSLSEEARRRAAAKLHENFPRVLYETLKEDFSKDGKAYGGLLLQLVGKIAAQQVETLDEVKAIARDTRELPAGLKRVESNTEEILRMQRQGVGPARASALCNLPQRNQFFTGRESYLRELRDELVANARAALSGMPGVGKTQTAVEYAYRQFKDKAYAHVFYVHAASIEELLTDFASIARHLNLPVKDEPDFNRIAAAVTAWFEQHDGWLLIFDNADDLKVLFHDGDAPEERHNYIPANRRGHVLLTRRPEDAGGVARTIEIKEMDSDEGALLLLRRAGHLTDKSAGLDSVAPEIAAAARKLAHEVGGLPLALDIAGAFIKETRTPPAEYLSLYREAGKTLRRERDEQDPYKHSVATVFSLAFQRLATPDTDRDADATIARAAADLLRLCAFLAAAAIPLEHFTAGASHLGDDLSRAMADKILWAKTKQRLLRFALLDPNPDSQTFDTHRLVQAVLRDEMDNETQCLWTERALLMLDKIFPSPGDFSNWNVCDLLLPHALDFIAHGQACNFRTKKMARLVNEVAFHLESRARYDEAEPLYLQALEISKEVLGERHSYTAGSLNNLAGLYYRRGSYEEAEPLYLQALEIRKEVSGEKHPDTAISINNLALLYRAQDSYEKAEPLYRRALEMWKELLGEKHPDTAVSLNNLAGLYYAQKRYEEAEPLFKQALEIRKEALGEKHPDTAVSLNNLAELYRVQCRYKEAEPLFNQALDIAKEVWGEKHPSTAPCLNNLAGLYWAQGHYTAAEPLLVQALEILEQQFGMNHPHSRRCRENLSTLRKRMSAQTRGREMNGDDLEGGKD